eukprot:2592857-Rhodomonas_salina.2
MPCPRAHVPTCPRAHVPVSPSATHAGNSTSDAIDSTSDAINSSDACPSEGKAAATDSIRLPRTEAAAAP